MMKLFFCFPLNLLVSLKPKSLVVCFIFREFPIKRFAKTVYSCKTIQHIVPPHAALESHSNCYLNFQLVLSLYY